MSKPTARDTIGNIRVQRGERTMSAALDLAARVEKVLATPKRYIGDGAFNDGWNACLERVLEKLDGEEP